MIRLAVGILVCAVTLLQLPSLLSPLAGGFRDDGTYLATAKALAEGHGYVIEGLPEQIAQTKYPVLFPALLAAIWKVHPSFPENLPLLRLVPLFAMWAWMWLIWKLVGEELGHRRSALWIVGAVLASPMTLYLGTQLLSETLFAAIATWAVLLMVRAERGRIPPGIGSTVLVALACALAFHTRTIGVTLLVPAALVLWRWKSTQAAAVFGSTWVLVCAPWFVWQSAHPAPADPVLSYYTKANYVGWNLLTGGGAAELGQVVGSNLLGFIATPALLWAFPPILGGPIVWLFVFVIAGWATLRMHPGAAAAAWVFATAGLLLMWPWPPSRFLLPVVPIVLFAVLDFAAGHSWTSRIVRSMLTVFMVTGVTQSAMLAVHVVRRDAPPAYARAAAAGATTVELMEGRAWVRANTPEDAVVAANLDSSYWLYAHRKAILAFEADPFKLFYAHDAPRDALGDSDDLHRVLTAHRVTHLVFEDLPFFRETAPLRQQIAELRSSRPGVLKEAWRSGNGGVVVYSVSM